MKTKEVARVSINMRHEISTESVKLRIIGNERTSKVVFSAPFHG